MNHTLVTGSFFYPAYSMSIAFIISRARVCTGCIITKSNYICVQGLTAAQTQAFEQGQAVKTAK